jgi:hypothetical protein
MLHPPQHLRSDPVLFAERSRRQVSRECLIVKCHTGEFSTGE